MVSNMLFNDLLSDVYKASGLDFDSRWKKWAKWVTAIDHAKDNGFAFVGDFLKAGTVEIKIGEPRVILVASETGSRQYRTTNYAVVVFRADGGLELTEIRDSDKLRGWALRLRGPIAELLSVLSPEEPPSPLTEFSDEDLIVELQRRGRFTTGG